MAMYLDSRQGPRLMPMDLSKTGDSYVLNADLPGIDPSSVDVNVDGQLLSIRAHVLDIVYRLITWAEGMFRFEQDRLPSDDKITVPIELENVIIEGARRHALSDPVGEIDDPRRRRGVDRQAR